MSRYYHKSTKEAAPHEQPLKVSKYYIIKFILSYIILLA